MTPERLAEIRAQVAAYQCQECALDVELLAYVDELRTKLILGRAQKPAEPMRQTIATVLLNESSHRDEYYGDDLPPGWWDYVYEWEQGMRNPEGWRNDETAPALSRS